MKIGIRDLARNDLPAAGAAAFTDAANRAFSHITIDPSMASPIIGMMRKTVKK